MASSPHQHQNQKQTEQPSDVAVAPTPSRSMTVEELANRYNTTASTASPQIPHSRRRRIRRPTNEWPIIIGRLTPLADTSTLGEVEDITDTRVDKFLRSETFEVICVQAVQIATLLPSSPPPATFVSFSATPMHQWYSAILQGFVEVFMRRLRDREQFPTTYKVDPDGIYERVAYEDMIAFNAEATAHIRAILTGFNTNFEQRPLGSTVGIMIDTSQRHSIIAAGALREAVQVAEYPPKKDWKVGEPLHAEYKRRLRMFEVGVMRLIEERDQAKWMLRYPGKLDKGVNAFKEYYIKHLRGDILSVRGGVAARSGQSHPQGITADMEEIFL